MGKPSSYIAAAGTYYGTDVLLILDRKRSSSPVRETAAVFKANTAGLKHRWKFIMDGRYL